MCKNNHVYGDLTIHLNKCVCSEPVLDSVALCEGILLHLPGATLKVYLYNI